MQLPACCIAVLQSEACVKPVLESDDTEAVQYFSIHRCSLHVLLLNQQLPGSTRTRRIDHFEDDGVGGFSMLHPDGNDEAVLEGELRRTGSQPGSVAEFLQTQASPLERQNIVDFVQMIEDWEVSRLVEEGGVPNVETSARMQRRGCCSQKVAHPLLLACLAGCDVVVTVLARPGAADATERARRMCDGAFRPDAAGGAAL